MASNKMPTKNLKSNQVLAIEWIEAQLLKPTERFSHKPGEYINDLHEFLRTQKMRILFSGPLESGIAYKRVKDIKDYLNKRL